jgi:penicillin-binding protein 1B
MKNRKSKKTKNTFPSTFFKLLTVLVLIVLLGLVYLDAKVRYGLGDRSWQLPTRVYARSLNLSPGRVLAADDLQIELSLLGYQPSRTWRTPGTYHREGDDFWIYSRGHQSLRGQIKAQRFHAHFSGDTLQTLTLAAGGAVLPQVSLEGLEIGSIYPQHNEDRLLVRLDEVPRSLVEILIAIEDRYFYQHWGVSLRAIGRAVVANYNAGQTVQGGSTITQQLVKNVFLSRDRSLWRKGVEAIMALLVELHFSKDEILELYINEVYLGQEGPRAIHGFALASQHYFNQPLAELGPSQIALLVGLVKGPSYYDPWRHADRAKERRGVVLQVMASQELITDQQKAQYSGEDLALAKSNAQANFYPAYLDLVRRQLRRDYSANSLQTQGMKIFTAFDPVVQRHAEASLAKILKTKPEQIEGAMVVTDVTSGDVVAVVGGRNMRYAGFNRALDAVRPIGSLMKPVIYLAALERSSQYTLASTISDSTVEVAGEDGSVWRPRNFDRKSHGSVLLHRALSQSYNQASARLGMEIGLDKVLAMSKRLGVNRKLPAVPAVLLGAGDMAPIEVAAMYQTIAAHGVYSPLRTIVNIANREFSPIARYPVVQEPVVDPSVMHLLHYSLMEVVREGTGKSAYSQLPPDFAVAGKTGTTDDLRDSWFAGYAGDYLSVVWLGRDDNTSAGLTGSSGALKVWTEFINRASHKPLDFNAPPGVVYYWVDQQSGELSSELCEGARYLPFVQGSAPVKKSSCTPTLPGVWKWCRRLF